MRTDTKVVVIGAGIGGLTTAALLAKAGMDVTVLEAHVDPGGCAATFYHQGYRFDAGATLVGGFQPGGAHDLVGQALGIPWPVRRSDPAMEVVLPDERVSRWGDPERWEAERRRVFPGTERFWRAQEWAADRLWRFSASAPAWPAQRLSDFPRLLARIRPELLGLAPGAVGSVADWARLLGASGRAFRTFVDAQLLISAQATSEKVTPLYGAVALDLARQGVYHVERGVGGIAETLVGTIRRLGGKVLFKRRVQSILMRGGKAIGVRALSGPRHATRVEEYLSDIVIANVTPWSLTGLLSGDESGEDAFLTSDPGPQGSSAPMWGAFTMYLGVDDGVAPPDGPEHYQVVVDDRQPLGEGNSAFISVSPTWDASRAPAGQRAVTLSTHTDVGPWWRIAQDRAAYEDRRDEYAERLIRAGERALPGLRRHIRLALPGTPVTFRYYTQRPLGMVGGFPQTSLFRARGPRTSVGNVLLVGDSIFPGQSTAGVSIGALRVASEILGRQARPITRRGGQSGSRPAHRSIARDAEPVQNQS
ncbi:MAG: FAD-dependent oxidoreductase [Anaerolineae bacterium]